MVVTCPFKIGDFVKFAPKQRTIDHYQDISRFGVNLGDVVQIASIKDGVYLYFQNGSGGWPWNEFEAVSQQANREERDEGS